MQNKCRNFNKSQKSLHSLLYLSCTIINDGVDKMIYYIENLEDLGCLGEMIKKCIDSTARKVFAEMFEDYENNRMFENSTISSDELCKHWGRCKNSLRNLEKDGVIAPLPVGGKTKMYSMKDVLKAEEMNPKLKRIA